MDEKLMAFYCDRKTLLMGNKSFTSLVISYLDESTLKASKVADRTWIVSWLRVTTKIYTSMKKQMPSK